ncbi:MAG: hypothetical protein JSR18_16735 [Proteobacteria bacterium]|nr:hypothetical protein [Pseudomonadota bacterium]
MLAVAAGLAPRTALAVPPTREQITEWCNDVADMFACGRAIEAHQLKALPGLARRDGPNLIVQLFPSGTTTFTDVDDAKGDVGYALWDTLDPINAVVLYVTRDDRGSYIVLQRVSGTRTELPTDPALSPDRARLVTADFCVENCTNELVLWRVERNRIVREAAWTPATPWSDASVRWKDADTLVLDYTAVGRTDTQTLERKVGDAGWRKSPGN